MTAIRFLHVGNTSKHIASCFHRDIKSANIVLKQDLTAHFIDCGLAKFVVDSDLDSPSSASLKGTPGYICPEYQRGGIPFDCSCDVYSFGVVLIELWTGTQQNHKDDSNTSFDFIQQYIGGRKGPKRDVKAGVDPVFGYDSSELPQNMIQFVDLAMQCMEDHDDIPTTDVAISQLAGIFDDCCAHEDATSERHADISQPLEQLNMCERCRSFPKLPDATSCRLCWDAEEQRNVTRQLLSLLFATQTKLDEIGAGTNAANIKLDTIAPVLGNLDARITSVIPRYFLIVPASKKNTVRNPKEYLRGKISTKYYLFFVCAHTGSPIDSPIKIHVNKGWVEKVAPVLVISMRLLQCGMCGLGVYLSLEGFAFHLSKVEIREMSSEFTAMTSRDANNLPFNAKDVPELRGDAYDLIVEKAAEQSDWRKLMEPVRTTTNPAILWVTNDVANDERHGYIRAC